MPFMLNSDKIVLDLCAGSGSWSKPYVAAGYDVRLITLPGNDVQSYHPPGNVYGILAAPPCTQFSLARTTPAIPTDFKLGMVVVNHCLRIIHECLYWHWSNHSWPDFKFWALENPAGYLFNFLGKPALEFQPWHYGDNYTKKTHIWGKFQQPVDDRCQGRLHLKFKEFCYDTKSQALKSITPAGFARAFFEANQ